MKSIVNTGKPQEHAVIFKYPILHLLQSVSLSQGPTLLSYYHDKRCFDPPRYKGGPENEHGMDVTCHSEQRTTVLKVLCSIMAFCSKEIYPHVMVDLVTQPPCTLERLERLHELSR